jgi:uridine kinase
METAGFIVGLIGLGPIIWAVYNWGQRRISNIVGWKEVYEELDKFIVRYHTRYPDESPDTIVAIGFGGAIISTYISQYFPSSTFVHVAMEKDEGGARQLDRHELAAVSGKTVLIVQGVCESGWALDTAVTAIREAGNTDTTIRSYAFAHIFNVATPTFGDGSLARPEFYSIQSTKLSLPWYAAREPSTKVGVEPGARLTRVAAPRPTIEGEIRQLSFDLSNTKDTITTRSPVIVDMLCKYIANSPVGEDGHYNVLISGPGAVGKSDFAQTLHAKLPDSTYLPLDAAVKDSKQRDQDNADGYQLRSYNLPMISNWIAALRKEETFKVRPFNHSSREFDTEIVVKGSARTRIIDWVFALSDHVETPGNLKIVLDCGDIERYQFLYDRFTQDRSMGLDETTLAVQKRVSSSRAEVDPTIDKYDVKFVLGKNRRITQIHCNLPSLNRILQEHF